MRTNVLENTILYEKLNEGFEGSASLLAKDLASMVKKLCQEASDRMKMNILLHPQFTLHDDTHLIRVTEIMAKILGNDMIKILNPIEIAILILSAYYHDVGMIIDEDTFSKLESSDNYKLHKANWIIDHPNYNEILVHLRNSVDTPLIFDRMLRARNELENALFTDYIRTNHAGFSRDYILRKDSESSMWKIGEDTLAPIVAKICASHCVETSQLTPANGYFYDENISFYKVNTIYLSTILRLADILDFDRERTPDSIYRTIHFTNDVSLTEWEKHRSITGWEISSKLIRFTAKCTHPVYQRAVLMFMDWIDNELNNCHNLSDNLPADVSYYKLNLPRLVNRSRITPKDSLYIYHDLEFSLSRDEIVKLLMMDELYQTPSLCVRELLQNSLDALRHRRSRMKSDLNVDWNDGKIEFIHSLDEYGREVLTCIDNGIGMDEEIIRKYLTNCGKSYYRSPEFEQEKALLYSKGIGFEPCSQFGIGFMSCFMIGDLINIKTKKDYGNGKPHGKPLHIEISGLNSMITIRQGNDDQPIGTTVSITGRAKPEYFDEWTDIIKLTDVLEGYAMACEFPIMAKCSIEEIASENNISAGYKVRKTFIEEANLPNNCYKTYEQEFIDIDPNVHGKLRVSFLVDGRDQLVLGNEDALWQYVKKDEHCRLVTTKEQQEIQTHDLTSSCCDGILVCGTPGYEQKTQSRLGHWANMVGVGLESFIVDIRNNIRPQLAPSRIAKKVHFDIPTSWKYIQDIIDRAQGKLWEQVLEGISSKEEIEVFIKIATIYRFELNKLSPELIRDKLLMPVYTNDEYKWCNISSINEIVVSNEGEKSIYTIEKNQIIAVDNDTAQYDSRMYGMSVYDNIIAALMCIVALEVGADSKLIYHVLNPHDTKYLTGRNKYDNQIFRTLFLPYWNSTNQYLAVVSNCRNINSNHPLTIYAKDRLYLREENALVDFYISLMHFVNDKSNFDDIFDGKSVRTMKYLGCKYKLVDWKCYPVECRPDYNIYILGYGKFVLSEDRFIEWSNIKKRIEIDD